MTDRELLELAARAAGYEVARWTDDGTALLLRGLQEPFNSLSGNTHCNFMADAFHLMARLHLSPRYYGDLIEVCQHRPDGAGVVIEHKIGRLGSFEAETAFAVTRAAAEIGNGMQPCTPEKSL